MPRNVIRFERLMYLALGISVVAALLYPSPYTQRLFARSPLANIVAGYAAVTGLYILGIWLIARRRMNFVRWASIIGFVIGLPFGLKDAFENYQTNPMGSGAIVIEDMLQGVAFCFVFSGDARPWFRKDDKIGSGGRS